MKNKLILMAIAMLMAMTATAQKREMRGAWIQCVNGQFQNMGTKKMQQTLTYQLDELKKDGVNVIIFQVRPECDALYESNIEPWSRFLTGVQGKAPNPYWDPLQWMVDECHKRGMECHAWVVTVPSGNTDIIGKIPSGTKINVTEVKNDWGHVVYDGVDGWVSMAWVENI